MSIWVFPAMKMKIGFGAAYDVKNVTAVRQEIGPDVLFAVDANCGYDVGTAIDVGHKIAHNDLFWYEEPIPTDDVQGYLQVKGALPIRIAGGGRAGRALGVPRVDSAAGTGYCAARYQHCRWV